MKIKNIFSLALKRAAAAAVASLALIVPAHAQLVEVYDRQSVSIDGYFPQLNDSGTMVLSSTTDARTLSLLDLRTRTRTVVANEGLPGFEARFSPDGKVYYITMRQTNDHLVYRTAHEFDPATGTDRALISGQRGALHAINGTAGLALVGEHKSWNLKNAGTLAWTLGPDLMVVTGGNTATYRPVPQSVGLLWSDVSPNGQRILMEAAGRGLTITDLQGRVQQQWGVYMMPSWWNDNLIVAQTTGNRIVVINADNGRTQTIASGDCYHPMTAGNKVIYTTKKGKITILSLCLPGERPMPEPEAEETDDSEASADDAGDEGDA